jgi:hypothetical protein
MHVLWYVAQDANNYSDKWWKHIKTYKNITLVGVWSYVWNLATSVDRKDSNVRESFNKQQQYGIFKILLQNQKFMSKHEYLTVFILYQNFQSRILVQHATMALYPGDTQEHIIPQPYFLWNTKHNN